MITGEQIRAVRKRLREKQGKFAQRFGVNQSTVHRWETKGLPDHGPTQMAVKKVLSDLSEASA